MAAVADKIKSNLSPEELFNIAVDHATKGDISLSSLYLTLAREAHNYGWNKVS